MPNVKIKTNHLVFLTAGFPYGNHETFIETEILFLSKHFSTITIISNDVKSDFRRKTPENVKVLRLRYEPLKIEKLISLRFVFNRLFWKEINFISNKLKLKFDFGKIKTLLVSLQNASRLRNCYQKIIEENNIKKPVIYSYWLNDSALALSFLNLKKNDYKFISKMHRWDIYFEESKYGYLPMRNYILNSLDSIYSISSDGIKYIENLFSNKYKNLNLSRLGIYNNLKYLNTCNKDFIIVSCSNVIDVKRVTLIAESLANIKIDNLVWTHFGDGINFNNLINYCEIHLKNKIKYNFPGRVTNKQIMDFYNQNFVSLFINVSSSEGVPVSIMEAMSFGIPAIATNVGGTSEIVNNDNGFLIDDNPSPIQVSEKITEYYLLSRDEKNKKRHLAYKTWEDKYNADKNYTQFVEDILCL